MAVPKKKKSKSKRNQRHAVWKGKAAIAAQKAISLGKSVLTGKAQGLIDANELAAEASFLLLLIVRSTLFSVAFSRIN